MFISYDVNANWPRVFHEPPASADDFLPDDRDRVASALAVQIIAYNLCDLATPPEHFEKVMAMMAEITGAKTQDEINAAFDRVMAERKAMRDTAGGD